jgi:hypothetical protein
MSRKKELQKEVDQRLARLNTLYGYKPIKYTYDEKSEMYKGKGEGIVVRYFFAKLELKYITFDKNGEKGRKLSEPMTRPAMIKFLDNLIKLKEAEKKMK